MFQNTSKNVFKTSKKPSNHFPNMAQQITKKFPEDPTQKKSQIQII